MPGVCFGRYRTVAFDRCKTIKVRDTPRNRAWLGRMNAAHGQTGYPVIQLMTLVETGIRAEIGSIPIGAWLVQSWTIGPPLSGLPTLWCPQMTRSRVLLGVLRTALKLVARC